MKKQLREVRYFLFGQHFSDSLRIVLAILIPSVVLAQFGYFQLGLMVSLGALCVSIVDAPGPLIHKRNGMLVCWGLIVVVTLITGFARLNAWALGVEILLFSFLFSMLGVYGNRATAIGTASLLVMILMMDRPLPPAEVWRYTGLVFMGGLWYLLISLAFFQILPYRAAQQALGECIHAISKFLIIKADFYRAETDLQENYRKLIAQQVIVSEKQDAVREVLFKTRQVVEETTQPGRLLVLTFVDVVDLYEQIVAMYYDYTAIHDRFGHTGILDDISNLIHKMAIELDYIGLAIQSNRPYTRPTNLNFPLERLKIKIDAIGKQESDGSNLVLRKLLVSLRNLHQRLRDMLNYSETRATPRRARNEPVEYGRFVSHQAIDLKVFRDNLSTGSSVFRHSLRMTLACLIGFIVAKQFALGHHSYWILLTIIVILKPAYSLTKERNVQRLIGTLVGGAIGVGVLLLTNNPILLFVCMVLLMIGAFSFQRTHYIVLVTLMTPYILILFYFLGIGGFGIVEERILDTIIGSVIAFAVSYLFFPNWESTQLKNFLRDVVQANANYLQTLADGLSGKSIRLTDYKLARKEVYVSSANLSAAFQRMISEPASKQWHRSEVLEFVVLNHILSSNIATIASGLVTGDRNPVMTSDTLKPVKRSLTVLHESLKKLDTDYQRTTPESGTGNKPDIKAAKSETPTKLLPTPDEQLLKGQLEFIQKISADVGKLTDALLV